MHDHPGWDRVGQTWLRAANTSLDDVTVLSDSSPDGADVFVPPDEFPAAMPAALRRALRGLGPVGRWASPSLWDAVATAIIRQVIRADQARLQHQRLRRAHGPAIQTPHGVTHALPSPKTVTELRSPDFKRLGMAFKATPLLHAASAYVEHGATWSTLPPAQLVNELQMVPRIGPWTAGAAVADFTHDWSLYPHGDLAVRTWAKTAAPDTAWPTTETEFAEHWRTITGRHLGLATLLILAWGAHHAEHSGP